MALGLLNEAVNHPTNKVAGVRHILEKAGAPLTGSPDPSPTEDASAKPKAIRRDAAEHTIDGLQNSIGKPLDTFSERNRVRQRHQASRLGV